MPTQCVHRAQQARLCARRTWCCAPACEPALCTTQQQPKTQTYVALRTLKALAGVREQHTNAHNYHNPYTKKAADFKETAKRLMH